MVDDIYWDEVLADERWQKWVGRVVAIGRKHGIDWQTIEDEILESIHFFSPESDELPQSATEILADLRL